MTPLRRGWHPAVPVAVAVASLSICAGVAFAGGGGVTPPDPPKVTNVVCISTCGGIHKATTGSKVQLSGRHLKHVREVRFKADGGGRVAADPIAVSSRSVKVWVPDGAATGKPKVSDSYHGAKSPTELKIVPASQIEPSGNFKLRKASARPHRSYYYGKKKPSVTYMFTNTEPTDVRIDVVKRPQGTVVDSWIEHAQVPNMAHTAKWSGVRHHRPAFNGTYKFRVGPKSGSMKSTTDSRFQYHRFEFPVRGPHSYNDGVGAPRSGHIHEGQDVLARCGTPLVAVRGGRVQWRAYQGSGAGYYLVIDGKRTGHDWMYAHLRRRSHLRQGQVVRTGQRIGVVGQTGDATGCHLHIEEWSAPGWYEGGHFLKAITRHLKQWDRWS
jgi:murein DD-endopeptidase MepM/ murein hydrolase activator NlpD